MKAQLSPSLSDADHGYDVFLENVKKRFASFRAESMPLFITDVPGETLWRVFLANIPHEHRQHYTCHCCRQFIEHFGNLVVVGPNFSRTSAIWDTNAPEFFQAAVWMLKSTVENAIIVGQFLDHRKVFGTPVTGAWRHLSVECKVPLRKKSLTTTDFQAMADKKEEFGMLGRGIGEYPLPVIQQAIRVLEAGSTAMRAEKVMGPLKFLETLHQQLANKNMTSLKKNAAMWMAVATAPAGFCHVKQSVASTLLDDIKAGLPFEELQRRFSEKMDPLQYQRPTAAPKAGAIDQAEKLFEQMGAASALKRRWALLSEIPLLWAPDGQDASGNGMPGLFGHLRKEKRTIAPVALPEQTMTWAKFGSTLLPKAVAMKLWVSRDRLNFQAFTTQDDPSAVPLLQWDDPERRNPFSSYVYHGGRQPEEFGLPNRTWVPVVGITSMPHEWNERPSPNQPVARTFLLEGCADLGDPGLCLFPETIRSEFHGVRSVIEAHSKSMKMGDYPGAKAAGIAITQGNFATPIRLEVSTELGTQIVNLDRWD